MHRIIVTSTSGGALKDQKYTSVSDNSAVWPRRTYVFVVRVTVSRLPSADSVLSGLDAFHTLPTTEFGIQDSGVAFRVYLGIPKMKRR